MSVQRASSPRWMLGRYELGAKIAEGGMATIFVARRVVDREMVAIKRVREDFACNKDFVTMFLDEAKIVARLRHPSIVRYLELGMDGPQAFIAMELLRGQSLWAVWDACRLRGRKLGYETIAWVGARVAEGLHYAHELVDERGVPLDIVHRDVNATNIFVTYEGGVRIIDFGLAKAANRASKTAAGIIKGKVAYMSPEQAVGAPIDRRTDVFALGTTLWELACDRRLFKHTDEMETLKRVHAAEVPPPTSLVPGFPPAFARVLMRALQRDKERRHATCAELARDLDAFARRGASAGSADRAAELGAWMAEVFSDERNREAEWATAWENERSSRPQSLSSAARHVPSHSRRLIALPSDRRPRPSMTTPALASSALPRETSVLTYAALLTVLIALLALLALSLHPSL